MQQGGRGLEGKVPHEKPRPDAHAGFCGLDKISYFNLHFRG